MSKRSIADYKIGDELFRYVTCAGVFRYAVIGRRERDDEVQLEVECKTCSHGWQCQLLLARNDYGRIVAVHMLNDDEQDSQRHFHGNEGYHFWDSPKRAKDEHLRNLIGECEAEVRKAEESLAARRKRLAELKGLVEGVQP